MLLNDSVSDQTENFLYLQCYLVLTDHVKTRLFVNKWGSSKQYKTTSILSIFFTSKGFHKQVKYCDLKLFFLKYVFICPKMIFLWLLINCNCFKTIQSRSKLFNHNKFVGSFDINSFTQNGSAMLLRTFNVYRF